MPRHVVVCAGFEYGRSVLGGSSETRSLHPGACRSSSGSGERSLTWTPKTRRSDRPQSSRPCSTPASAMPLPTVITIRLTPAGMSQTCLRTDSKCSSHSMPKGMYFHPRTDASASALGAILRRKQMLCLTSVAPCACASSSSVLSVLERDTWMRHGTPTCAQTRATRPSMVESLLASTTTPTPSRFASCAIASIVLALLPRAPLTENRSSRFAQALPTFSIGVIAAGSATQPAASSSRATSSVTAALSVTKSNDVIRCSASPTRTRRFRAWPVGSIE
mmetsp:Transcript_38506/g.112717  ORF Transcript_38506/g.112717 Transcript_38506/m.112717 type:complete len:277 (-) Transcript_38506:764-1594(-)